MNKNNNILEEVGHQNEEFDKEESFGNDMISSFHTLYFIYWLLSLSNHQVSHMYKCNIENIRLSYIFLGIPFFLFFGNFASHTRLTGMVSFIRYKWIDQFNSPFSII